MSRYTLKTFCGEKQIERFEHRTPDKLRSILEHPRHNRAGECDPWGEPLGNPDRFEMHDSQREKIFDGNIDDALQFVRTIK